MKNRITSAGTDAQQSDAAEVPTSCQPCSNTFVVRSLKSTVKFVECENKILVINDVNGQWLLYDAS